MVLPGKRTCREGGKKGEGVGWVTERISGGGVAGVLFKLQILDKLVAFMSVDCDFNYCTSSRALVFAK